jgi:hypothetical protein
VCVFRAPLKRVVEFIFQGHPLDDYKYEIGQFDVSDKSLENLIGRIAGGIVTNVANIEPEKLEKVGNVTLEGYDEVTILSFNERLFKKFRHFLVNSLFISNYESKDGWVNKRNW